MPTPKTEIVPMGQVGQRILVIRGNKVMLDADLAEIFQVKTKALNQAIKRNIDRFPSDFLIQLTPTEKTEVVTNCDHLQKLKYSPQLPYAFTEHGVVMLSMVLKSQRAIEVSVHIIRVFIKIREILSSNKELAYKIQELEREQKVQNKHINAIYSMFDKLLDEPLKPPGPLGFILTSEDV